MAIARAELEAQVAALIRMTLTDASAATRLMTGASSDEIGMAHTTLTNWLATATQAHLLYLAEKTAIEPGQLTVQIYRIPLADVLGTNAESLNEDAPSISSVFQIRKRGVETKLIFTDMPIGQDEALIRNIARAHSWFEQMMTGKTFA